MGTTRLSSSSTLVAKKVAQKQGSPLEIEVPAGETLYQIAPQGQTEHLIFHLRHPESKVIIRAIIQAGESTSPSLTTEVIHHSAHTQADTLIKTLARDQAQPRYQGLIRIEEGAKNCESYLNHHSLILSPTASSWTLPSLEIKNNQVKCSHAATIRTITNMDLFYLRSRGIGETEARELLIKAFLEN